MKRYDWVIRDALVYDGTGDSPVQMDVAVDEDRISALGIGLAPGLRECFATGLCLAPGFVDVHSHDDFAALLDPGLSFKALQGVTSEVVGNCGIGAAPRSGARAWIERLHPGVRLPDYEGYGQYLLRLEEAAPAINLAVLAGHGSLRTTAAPTSSGPLSGLELKRFEGLLDEALEAGIVGLSSGLIYEPGCHADESELIALCRRLGQKAPLYATHLRNEADHLIEAVDEALRIAEAAGVGLQLSHHKAHGRNNWGKVAQSLARVDAAVARGVDVWLDQYPYTAGSTILSAIVEQTDAAGNSRLGRMLPENLVLATVVGHPEIEGRNLGELMNDWQTDRAGAAARVLELDAGAWVIVHAMCADDVERVMRHPRTLFGSDGIPTTTGRPHPRLCGTFPHILGHYGRERGVLSLSEAIARMTRKSAQRFGLRDRGIVRAGAFADLVLFDASRVAAGATYDEPRRAPLGIHKVWVNGSLLVDEGQSTGARPGRVLRSA